MRTKQEILEEFKKEIPEMQVTTQVSPRLLNADKVLSFLSTQLDSFEKEIRQAGVTENTSDGYHTFKELYEFRKLYNAALFNEWAKEGKYNIHKSKRHHDGELCFGGGWFIVMADLPTGQISNHYELNDWDLFNCEEREKADEWDGHTAQDVAKRLSNLLSPQEKNLKTDMKTGEEILKQEEEHGGKVCSRKDLEIGFKEEKRG